MSQFFKRCLQAIPGYNRVRTWMQSLKQGSEVTEWETNGRPSPPPHVIKQNVLKQYADQYDLKTLVETGTYRGDMVEAMKGHFSKVYSIELSEELFRNAARRFHGSSNVEIMQGDSGLVIEGLVNQLERPALFWLDGHYSAGKTAKGEKETPVCEELNHILGGSALDHIILIDDARLFGTDPAYPTLDAVRQQVANFRAGWSVTVDTDSIRITPGEKKSLSNAE